MKNKIKKTGLKFIKIVSVFFLIIIAIVGCFLLYAKLHNSGVFASSEEVYFYDKLKIFKESGKPYIKLRKLTNFPWKVACATRPYGDIGADEDTYIDFYYKDTTTRIFGHQALAKDAIGSRLYFGTLYYNMEAREDLIKYLTGELDSKYLIEGCFNNKASIRIDHMERNKYMNFFYLTKNREQNENIK
ncbi:hypothetical protein SPONN_1249 [uncultured Candidatus Thioglobus sp.]|nr:hypothetical protein SPONN_1249 [uncultured Candidatus Thioglobus sp.]